MCQGFIVYYPAKEYSPGIPWVCIYGIDLFTACSPEMEVTPYSADSRGLQFLESERSFGVAGDQCSVGSDPSSSGMQTKLPMVWIAVALVVFSCL
jgi:hypothetical protein